MSGKSNLFCVGTARDLWVVCIGTLWLWVVLPCSSCPSVRVWVSLLGGGRGARCFYFRPALILFAFVLVWFLAVLYPSWVHLALLSCCISFYFSRFIHVYIIFPFTKKCGVLWVWGWLFFDFLNKCSKLDHPGIATLIAAHAKPPNYMFFFKLYESSNLGHKLHVEEWAPTVNDALMITMQLGMIVISACIERLHYWNIMW